MKTSNDNEHHLVVKAPDGERLGLLRVHTFAQSPSVKGVRSTFKSEYPKKKPSLKKAAKKIGADHFNWYQVIIVDTSGKTRNACGSLVTVPYVDPPCGGYPATAPGANDGQWSDKLPWFWDETEPPPGYGAPWSQLNNNIKDGKTAIFYDEPAFHKGQSLVFNTWLVSVNKDGRLNAFHGGFSWESISHSEESGSVRLRSLLFRDPTEAEFDDLVLRGDMSYCWFWL